MYENGKTRPVEGIPGLGDREIKDNDGGGEFNFCNCHNVPPLQQ
jgi:hypothetical protein